MPVEVFVYRGDDAARRSLPELQADLAAAGVRCRIEELEDGPWLILDGYKTDMSVDLDRDGTATSVMIQRMDSATVLDPLFRAFERLGWVVVAEDEYPPNQSVQLSGHANDGSLSLSVLPARAGGCVSCSARK